MIEITPVVVAEHLHGSEVRENRQVAGWVDVACDGAVLRIAFTPKGAPARSKRFRAVVAEISEDAMGNGPLRILGTRGGRALLDLSDFSDMWDATPEQMFQAATQMVAAASLAMQVERKPEEPLDETCGDCMTGRCHGDGPCGCARHDASVEAGR